jgi:hypothetical protein
LRSLLFIGLAVQSPSVAFGQRMYLAQSGLRWGAVRAGCRGTCGIPKESNQVQANENFGWRGESVRPAGANGIAGVFCLKLGPARMSTPDPSRFGTKVHLFCPRGCANDHRFNEVCHCMRKPPVSGAPCRATRFNRPAPLFNQRLVSFPAPIPYPDLP